MTSKNKNGSYSMGLLYRELLKQKEFAEKKSAVYIILWNVLSIKLYFMVSGLNYQWMIVLMPHPKYICNFFMPMYHSETPTSPQPFMQSPLQPAFLFFDVIADKVHCPIHQHCKLTWLACHMIQLPVDHMITDYCSAQHYCIAGKCHE